MHRNASDIVKTKGEKLCGVSYKELHQQLKKGEVIVAIYDRCLDAQTKTEPVMSQEIWNSLVCNYIIRKVEFFALSHAIYENILES